MIHCSHCLFRFLVFVSLLFASSNATGQLRKLPEPANANLPSVFLIGDSTVRNGDGSGGDGQWGWGEPMAQLFDDSQINVVNRAVGGLSSRTYRTSGYWQNTLQHIKPGDFVIMQFGHNDTSALNDGQRARGTIRGAGDETEEIVNQLTGQPEVVHSYGWYLKSYISEAIAKGAHPIVCSPIPRKSWHGDRVNRATTNYSLWARQAAEAEGVPYIDLNDIIAERYEAIGAETVESMFADAHTHTTLAGAKMNAKCVVAGLRALPDVGLVKYLSKAGQTIQPAKANQVLIPDNRPMLDDSNSPAVTATDVAIPTLYIMGDSTVRNGYMQGIGWGEMFGEYFGPHKLNVLNKAIGGRSTRSFMREKRWEEIYKQLKPGDVVIMQFGHNDGGRVGDPRFKRRPSLPGIGDEIQEVTMEDGTVETVHSYGWYLKQFCNGAKEKGAVAIICSPVPHKDNWHDSKFEPDFQGHREWCQQIAEATGALSIDLTAVVGAKYQELGEAKVNTLFADARTHTNAAGAKVNAECVVAGLKSLESQPLNRFLSDSGQNVGGNGLVEESVSAHAE